MRCLPIEHNREIRLKNTKKKSTHVLGLHRINLLGYLLLETLPEVPAGDGAVGGVDFAMLHR